MKLEQYIKEAIESMKNKGIIKADFSVRLDSDLTVNPNSFNHISFTVDLSLEEFTNKN